MTSSENIHETITRMRRRLLEIDALIARFEREQIEPDRIPVHVVAGNKNELHLIRLCRRTRRDG
jgi:hypothetical protein